MKRYLSIWLPHLVTEKIIISRPELKNIPFVVSKPERNRMVIKAASRTAMEQGITRGMVVADARAIMPQLMVLTYKTDMEEKLLSRLAIWCLRFTPVAGTDGEDGLLLDISGCPHLWGGERTYRETIIQKLNQIGFTVKAAIADTIGAAWAVARYSHTGFIVPPGHQIEAIKPLPPAALRLEPLILQRLQKLGFSRIGQFIQMPNQALRRRFGQTLLQRIHQALGQAIEQFQPVQEKIIYQKRLPCLDPVKTRAAIDIALKTVTEQLCQQLTAEGKGLRTAIFKCYRTDGQIQEIKIGTHRPLRNVSHLLKLFEQKISTIRPGWGIELFILEAPITEDLSAQQESLWHISNHKQTELSNLLDRIMAKTGSNTVQRYLPAEHFWPERSFRNAVSIFEKAETLWRSDQRRPVVILPRPEKIEVTVPLPDYPPMMFIHRYKRHTIKKADGPERIEREWWQDKGKIRDYYIVEDEMGARYWLFRSGQYGQHEPEWFLHGFFA